MNCLECQDILQRRLDGVPIASSAALDAHLAECPLCRQRHAAAARLLQALAAAPQPMPPSDLAGRIVAVVLRDRERRRLRLRRSLYVTMALAASILIMLVVSYFSRPAVDNGKPQPGPIAAPKQDAVAPPVAQKKDIGEPGPQKKQAPATLAGVTERLADKTLDHAKVLWAAANPAPG